MKRFYDKTGDGENLGVEPQDGTIDVWFSVGERGRFLVILDAQTARSMAAYLLLLAYRLDRAEMREEVQA